MYVAQIWDKVEHYLKSALNHSGGEYNIEHLKQYLVQGNQVLLIAIDENDNIHGAMTIQWDNFPNERIAFITTFGGKMVTDKDLWNQLETWVRQNGGTAMRGAVRKAVARYAERLFGFKSQYIITEKKL
jgi:hypothetical protein